MLPPSEGWQGLAPNPRLALTDTEERRVFGLMRPAVPVPFWMKELHQSGHRQTHAEMTPAAEESKLDEEDGLYAALESAKPVSSGFFLAVTETKALSSTSYPSLLTSIIHNLPQQLYLYACSQVHVPACPVVVEIISSIEEWLASLVYVRAPPAAIPPYPLRISQAAHPLPLEKDMHAELQASWDAHHKLYAADGIDLAAAALKAGIAGNLATVQRSRKQVESHLLIHVSTIPKENKRQGGLRHTVFDSGYIALCLLEAVSTLCHAMQLHGACFRFMRVCAAAPHINLTDLARAAVSAPDSWLAFNPFLSAGSCARLREACLIWMQLCVLEDRLHRISRLVGGGQESLPLLLQASGQASTKQQNFNRTFAYSCSSGKVTCPERQGPTAQTKRKSRHGRLLQQVGPHHGTYDTTARQALFSKLKTHP
eukprot:1161380-Pelagomonas_calceolata.AAC.5